MSAAMLPSPRLRRYAVGVTPVTRRNVVAKWLAVVKPIVRATDLMDEVESASSTAAAAIRRCRMKRCGDSPVARLNSRAK